MKAKEIIVLLVLFAGCTAKNPPVSKQVPGSDSLHVADSSTTIAAAQPELVLTYEQRQGKYLYEEYCRVCHGDQGKGDGFNSYNLNPRPRDFSDSAYMSALGDQQVFATIRAGGRSVNKSPLMPAYGWTLTKDEIQYIVAYVKTFSGMK